MSEPRITYCRICESYCGLQVEVEGSAVQRVAGDPAHPLSQGHLCVKGVALGELHHDPDRLRHPVRRGAGGLERVDWDTSLGDIATKLLALRDAHGPRSIAVYFGLGSFYSTLTQPVVQQFARGLGLSNIFSTMAIDCAALNRAAGAVLGDPFYIPLPDWERSRYMLLLGHNPLASRFGQFQVLPRGIDQLRAARAAGARVVIIDPRRTESGRQADEHHFIVPGTDVYFALALLHAVLQDRLFAGEFVQEHTAGFDALAAAVAPWSPERVEPLTGIPAAVTRRLAREFAAADGAFCIGHTGISQGPHGTLAEWAIFALNAITGNLDRPGGLRWCPPQTRPLPTARGPRAAKPHAVSRIGHWPRFLGEFPVATLADEILTPGPEQVRALVVVGGNPLLSWPNANKVKQALESLELLVCVDLWVNQTGAFAHYVLPAADQLERAEVTHPLIGRNSELPFIQYTPRLLDPVGEVREEWRIFRDLNRRLGLAGFGNAELDARVDALEAGGASVDAIRDVLLAEMLAPSGVTLDTLKQHPHGLVLGEPEFGKLRQRGWPTPDGRVQLAPPELIAALATLPAAPPEARDGLRLIGRRLTANYNSGLRNLPSLHKATAENEALLNDQDARRLNITAGQYVMVYNHLGEIRIKARPTADVAPGVVCIPHGWGHAHNSGQRVARSAPGANPNVLIDDADLERFTGNPRQNGTRVWVRPAD